MHVKIVLPLFNSLLKRCLVRKTRYMETASHLRLLNVGRKISLQLVIATPTRHCRFTCGHVYYYEYIYDFLFEIETYETETRIEKTETKRTNREKDGQITPEAAVLLYRPFLYCLGNLRYLAASFHASRKFSDDFRKESS